ncbi:MAG: hypothetical protein CVU64_06370 [Deltaproteobacteria bacterium HGW-Deltaproteobacteria-21]|nr:MAG: hypothetical protein CVU64_06370 [Deltaproteobacteria bacterium HGW-Deltaproteobacteria-21]
MNVVDAIRIKEFRQFKREIRGSREYEVVGIDIAKEKHHAFFGTAMGKTLLRREKMHFFTRNHLAGSRAIPRRQKYRVYLISPGNRERA